MVRREAPWIRLAYLTLFMPVRPLLPPLTPLVIRGPSMVLRRGGIPVDDSIGAPDAEHQRIPDLGAVGDSKSSSRTYSRKKIAPNKPVIQPTIADLLAGKKRSAGGGSQKDAPAAVPSPTSSDDFMATAKKRLADQAPFSCSKRTPHAGVRGGQVGLHVPNAPTAGPSVGTRKRGPRKVRFQVVQTCFAVRRFFRFTVLHMQ